MSGICDLHGKKIEDHTIRAWIEDYDKRGDKMGLTAKSEGKEFKQVPPGNYLAICYAAIDLGKQHKDAASGDWGSSVAKDVDEILLMWELPHELVTYEVDGVDVTKPQSISFFYTNSLHPKANLRKHLEAWRTKAFTQEELRGFNVKAVLGKPCMLNVVHENNKARITGVAAVPKGLEIPAQVNESIMFDLDNFDQAVFDKISPGIQNIIQRCAEWDQAVFSGEPETMQNINPIMEESITGGGEPYPFDTDTTSGTVDEFDDVPF